MEIEMQDHDEMEAVRQSLARDAADLHEGDIGGEG